MAEAAVQHPPKFFCHQCSEEIKPELPDFTCPRCQQGFIEELPDASQHDSQETDSPEEDDGNSSILFANLFGPRSMRGPGSEGQEVGGLNAGRRQHPFLQVHRRNPEEQPFHSLLEQLLSNLTGDVAPRQGGQARTFQFLPAFSLFSLHGNPADYAWGTSGLDNIITQLLNQLEGSGPPPAEKNQIDQLPTVTISKKHTDKNAECSVCMEDFTLEEKVRELPCQHMYHTDCIIPWLEIHGTCPVCRKTLDGQNTSTDEASGLPLLPNNNMDLPSSSSNHMPPSNHNMDSPDDDISD